MQILQQLQRRDGTWVVPPQKPLPEPGLPVAWNQGFPREPSGQAPGPRGPRGLSSVAGSLLSGMNE